MPRQIGDDKKQIAEFFLDMRPVGGLGQFAGFFDNLIKYLPGVGPVKADPSGALLQLNRAGQG